MGTYTIHMGVLLAVRRRVRLFGTLPNRIQCSRTGINPFYFRYPSSFHWHFWFHWIALSFFGLQTDHLSPRHFRPPNSITFQVSMVNGNERQCLHSPHPCINVAESLVPSLLCLNKIVSSLLSIVGYVLPVLPFFLIAHFSLMHARM